MNKQSFCKLNKYLQERQDNSFSSPPTQYASLLQLENRYSALISNVQAVCSADSSLPLLLRIFIDLHYSSGCRVSELLRLHTSNITPSGSVFVEGLKNSGDRYIYSSYFRLELIKLRKSNRYLFSEYSRFFIYRLYKQKGLYLTFNKSSNAAVTHVFRHLAAVTNSQTSEDVSALKSFFNHKSSKSTAHYVNKKSK